MKPRSGIALVLALLVLVLVEAMSAGIIVLATQARLVADSRTRNLRAQSAAEASVERVLGDWAHGGFDTMAVGAVVSAPGSASAPDEQVAATIERLAGGTYVVRANAQVGGGSVYARARAAAIARTLDRAALIAESNSALSSGGLVVIAGEAHLSANAATLPPSWADSVCPGTEPMPPPHAMTSAADPTIGESVTVSGAVAVDSTLAIPDSVALGGVRWSELAGIADRLERGTLTPAPFSPDSTCVTGAAGNWGDPLHQETPCSGYFPLIYADGDLTVVGGTGQGILAVAGTLTITGAFTFTGVVVARDGIQVSGGAELYGGVRSRAGYALVDASSLVYSRCAVARAALRTPSSARLILAQRRFIPAF